jgi:hypothetical protein
MISQKMVNQHIQKSLSEGGKLSKHLAIKELGSQMTDYIGIDELSYESEKNKAFYSAAYTLMDDETKNIVHHEKRRIGGFNIYPIDYRAENIKIVPRVFSGRYRMGFCNFEL